MTDFAAPPAPSAPRKRGFLVEIAVIAALAAVAAIAWFGFLRKPARPNVILISIDTLRADHLGCYGYGKPTSPHLDSLAGAGTLFERAHSTTSWTLPAHMALMTGLPDDLHEVVYDVVGLDPRRTMLAECFERAGYRTAGFHGGPYLDAFFGFGRGFMEYENCGTQMYGDDQRAAGASLDPAAQNLLLAAKERESHRVQTAAVIERSAEAFLERRADEDRPFFLFLHHWDVHHDFAPPEADGRLFAQGYPRADLDVSNLPHNPAIHAGMAPEDFAYLLGCYDGEIHWVDRQIGKLRAKLEELGLADDTLIVVTADHGEEFLEHGQKGHRNNLHDESLHVPLILAGPGVRKGVRVPEQVRLFDVMPTILDLAGLPPVPDCYGVSLRPLLEGDASGPICDLPLIAELTFVPKQASGAPETFYFKHKATSQGCNKIMERSRRAYDAERPIDFLGAELEPAEYLVFDQCADPGEAKSLNEVDDSLRRRMHERLLHSWFDLATKAGYLPRSAGERRILELPEAIDAAIQSAGYTSSFAPKPKKGN